MEIRSYSFPLAFCCACALSACGGGGGGGNSNSAVDEVAAEGTSVAVNKYSAYTAPAPLDTPAQADQAANETASMPNLSKSDFNQKAGTGTASMPALASFIPHVLNLGAATPGIVAGITEAVTDEPCDYGGTFSATATAATRGELSAGDSADATFNLCGLGYGLELDGRLAYVIDKVTGSPYAYASSWSLQQTIGAKNFKVTFEDFSGGESTHFLFNGGYTASTSYNPEEEAYTYRFQGATLGLEAKTQEGSTYGLVDVLMEDFDQRLTANELTGELVFSNDIGKLSSVALGASVSVDTTADFMQNTFYETYPHAGSFTITGANGQKVRLTALNATQVTLEYDPDGDGTFDSPITKNWSDLGAASPL